MYLVSIRGVYISSADRNDKKLEAFYIQYCKLQNKVINEAKAALQ